MKRLGLSVTVLAVLLALSLYNGYYSNQVTENLIQQLQTAQIRTNQNLWKDALQLTEDALQEWQNKHNYLHVVMRHSDTDEIDRAFQSVLAYLRLEEMDQYAAANMDLMDQLKLLSEMEQATFVNVL